MTRLRSRLCAVYTFALIATHIASAFGQSAMTDKLAAAERYATAGNFAAIWSRVVVDLAKNYPEEERAAFVGFMTKTIDKNKIHTIVVNSMIQTFTAEEMNALADFYSSPVGQSCLAKFADFQAAMMPSIHAEMLRVAKAYSP